jgi:hypothetical protein
MMINLSPRSATYGVIVLRQTQTWGGMSKQWLWLSQRPLDQWQGESQ